MPDFHNVRFPLSLAFGASGGPSRDTEITPLASGGEHRNAVHARSRRRYNAGVGVKSVDDLHTLIGFYEARMGQLHAFRFQDPLDHKSCRPSRSPQPTDQILGTGDGTTQIFQLVKLYADTAASYLRPITKPVAGSVTVALDGVALAQTDFILDELSGQIELNAPPGEGVQITGGFIFDVAVRFDTEHLDLALEAFGAGQLTNIALIEVREYA